MPVPNLDKEQYTPDEAYEAIKQHLGDSAAQQFKLYFNKVQKLPPHKVELNKLNSYGDETYEYQFKMGEFASKLGIPPEVLKFVMVPSPRHGGGSQDNMGWLWIKFKEIQSPEGNSVKVGILEEIQSDFSQRISRLRQVLNGKMKEDDLLPYEKQAWDIIKSNPELMESPQATVAPPIQEVTVGPFKIRPRNDTQSPWASPVVQLFYGPSLLVKHFYQNGDQIVAEDDIGSIPDLSKENFKRIMDAIAQHQSQISTVVDEVFKQIPKQGATAYKSTQLLKGIINKIESTSYSDILTYLFNKAVGFTKQRGCQQLWVPSSEMKMQEWKQNAQHGAEALVGLFKKIYDDNSVSFDAVRDLEKTITGQDFWVIDVSKVNDMKLANKKVLRLANASWKSKDGMDRTNWKFYFDTFYKSYLQNYNPNMEEDIQNEKDQGGTAYAEDDGARMYEIMENFIQELVPPEAYGDTGFVHDFKSYLKEKYNFDLPPEFESKLSYPAEDNQGSWRPVTQRPPSKEVDTNAPSVQDLNSMFRLESKSNKFTQAYINKLAQKDAERIMFELDKEMNSGRLKSFNFSRVKRTSDRTPSFYDITYETPDGVNVLNVMLKNSGDFNWSFSGDLNDTSKKTAHKFDKEYNHLNDFISELLTSLESKA